MYDYVVCSILDIPVIELAIELEPMIIVTTVTLTKVNSLKLNYH